MLRYFALLWDDTDNRPPNSARAVLNALRVSAPTWTGEIQARGLMLLHDAGRSAALRTYRFADDQGIILGRLFRRTATEELDSSAVVLAGPEAVRLLNSAGGRLIDDFWGGYVAILRVRGKACLLRDPTGAIACYYTRLGPVTAVYSHVEDFLRVAPGPLAINWRHVGACLRFGRVISSETGFEEVHAVQAGERVRIDGTDVERTFMWHPSTFCELPAFEDAQTAGARLRCAVQASVHGWASCHERILHELSGGLDSSIVLACLANATPRPDVVCFNMYTQTPEGDERFYARLAASRARFDLVETVHRSSHKTLEAMLSTGTLASPVLMTLTSESEEARARLAATWRAGAIFSGRGGDNLFQRRRGSFIGAEYVRRHGIRPRLLQIAAATANMTGRSIWSVLAAIVRQEFLRETLDPYAPFEFPPFLAPAAARCSGPEQIRHPWVSQAMMMLPASKAQQIFDVLDTQACFFPACTYAHAVHPLITQPVIETVLRIPSYVLTHGGIERGLIRRAFQADVPSRIIERTSKGSANRYYYELLLNNLDFVRSFLLDGDLVRQGVLERVPLEAALTARSLLRKIPIQPTMTALLAEAWVRRANTAARRIAA